MSIEFTNNNSKRVLLPLEPDFSNMSDPNVVIKPPDNNWRSDNRQTLQTSLSGCIPRRDQSRSKHKSKKRRRRKSSSTSPSSRSASSDSCKRSRKSKRSKHSHKKRRRYTFSSSSSSSSLCPQLRRSWRGILLLGRLCVHACVRCPSVCPSVTLFGA